MQFYIDPILDKGVQFSGVDNPFLFVVVNQSQGLFYAQRKNLETGMPHDWITVTCFNVKVEPRPSQISNHK